MFGIDIETFNTLWPTMAEPSRRHHDDWSDDLGFSQSGAVNEPR